MNSRRYFLKNTGWMAGSLLTGSSLLTACQSSAKRAGSEESGENDSPTKTQYPAPGLQLYTVRDAMEEAPEQTLARVAEIGFKNMESATYTGTQKFYGMDARKFSEVLRQNGLSIPSGHYMLGGPDWPGTILNGWEKAVEDAAEAGLKYMVCAYLMDHERENADQYRSHAEVFNKAAETCQQAGIQFCYHNHDFEFQEIDGQLPYDILLSETDADLVRMELDIYWATRAGYDPVTLFKENPGRYPLWHVKDLADDADQSFTEVGNGTIDWQRVFKESETAGMEYYFVEQDETPGSPFDSIRQSIDYLNRNIL